MDFLKRYPVHSNRTMLIYTWSKSAQQQKACDTLHNISHLSDHAQRGQG